MDTLDLIFSINCYASGSLSIVLSLVLLYCIICYTPCEMKNYRIFLLNVNISDLLVSSFMTILQWVPASSKKEVKFVKNVQTCFEKSQIYPIPETPKMDRGSKWAPHHTHLCYHTLEARRKIFRLEGNFQ